MPRFMTALKAFAIFALLLGLFYPLFITGISQLLMSETANGSLIEKNGKIIGSSLIGQKFTQPEYFHSRPSFINYDATNSGGSNLAPTSAKLIAQTTTRIAQIRTENSLNTTVTIPADMALTSGSGLDPHISPTNALLQLPRVAQARHLSSTTIEKLIDENTDLDFIGIWGKAGVNVLKLNLSLDEIQKSNSKF